MSEIDKMLDNMSDDDIALYLGGESPEEEHVVIDSDRKIIVPDSLKRIAVQHDHDIETVTFDCPRYWDGHDLSKMMVYVNHLCPSGALGCTVATNVTVDSTNSDIMHFDWTISECVTMAKGHITFLVCAKTQDEDGTNRHHWNSEICRDMYVSEGLELPDDFMETYPDVLTQVLLFNQNVLELQKTTMQRSAVYVGTGDVPDGYNVWINPNGDGPEGRDSITKWPTATLPFTETEISNTSPGAGFVTNPTNFEDGKLYFRYRCGPTNFTWTNPNPQKGAVTITLLGWRESNKDYEGTVDRLKFVYSDGTVDAKAANEFKNGVKRTYVTDSNKTLAQITGNHSNEDWVLLDMSVMSITTDYPAPANSTGTPGQIAFDSDYVYICTAANTWKRVALSTWT